VLPAGKTCSGWIWDPPPVLECVRCRSTSTCVSGCCWVGSCVPSAGLHSGVGAQVLVWPATGTRFVVAGVCPADTLVPYLLGGLMISFKQHGAPLPLPSAYFLILLLILLYRYCAPLHHCISASLHLCVSASCIFSTIPSPFTRLPGHSILGHLLLCPCLALSLLFWFWLI
jgi:hypothetical protein